MKFEATRDSRKKIIYVDGRFLIERTPYKTSMQAKMAWKVLKDEMKKVGWEIHIVDLKLPKNEIEEKEIKKKKWWGRR